MINRKEFYQPDELDVLAQSLDQTCKSLSLDSASDPDCDDRQELASILLHLSNLRQLGRNQLETTAVRLYRERCATKSGRWTHRGAKLNTQC